MSNQIRRQARAWLYFIPSVIVLLLATGCGSSSARANNPTAQTGHHATINQMVAIGSDWRMQVTAVASSQGVGDETPGGGNTYLILTLSINNSSGQGENLYTVATFTMQDSTGKLYTPISLSFVNPPNGTVGSHKTVLGQIAFEVPIARAQFTLRYSASDGQAFWDIQVPTT